MLRIKKIDSFGQVLLIVGFTVLFLVNGDSFLYGYFVLGSWQMLSMFVHLAGARYMPLHVARSYYEKLILVLVVLGVAAALTGLKLYFLLILLYTSPIIVLWYAWLSRRELRVWQAKNLIHLKN